MSASETKKFKVTMICKETWRAEIILTVPANIALEKIKDNAWADFDKICSKDLEQDNYTKIKDIT